MKPKDCLATLCVLLVATTVSADDDVPPVGALGEPSRLVIEGAKKYSADEIRAALFGELAVVAACDRHAPLAELTAVIAEKLSAGYKCAGFADVQVDVTASDGELRAIIEEGSRYTQGDVQITGCHAIDADRIRQSLTQPDKKLQKAALWTSDKPAAFNVEYRDWLTSKVIELAGDQGFYRVKVKVAVEPDQKTQQGVMRVEVVNEGPRTIFRDIEYSGAKIQLQELLPYLSIELHSPLTAELRRQIVQRLVSSGRFTNVSWELRKPEQRDDFWRPILQLEAYNAAPLLSEAPTREEAALLKLAEWVSRFDESDDELLIRFPAHCVSVIVAPRRGYLVELAPPVARGENAASAFLNAVVMAETRVGLYSRSLRRKIDAAPPPTPILGNAAILLIGGQPSWDSRGRLFAGVGFRKATTNALRRHVKMTLKLSASAALSVVRTHNAKATWVGDEVCLEWKSRRLKINSLTGQLVEQVVDASTPHQGSSGDSWLPIITLCHGEFERRLAEIEKVSADWPNVADERRPLSCVGQFVCQELAQIDSGWKNGYAAIEKLLTSGLLEPVDEVVRQAATDTDGFVVPQPYFHFEFNSVPELRSLSSMLARAFGMRLGNYLCPGEAWPGFVWRKGVFLLTDDAQQTADELAAEPSGERGAICAWLAAEMLRAAGFSQLSPVCARRGLRRLSALEFRNDCQGLLTDQGFLSTSLLQMVKALRRLDADEVSALGALLTRVEIVDEWQALLFQQCMAALRGSDDEPAPAVVARALDVLWHTSISGWLEQRLKSLAAAEAPAGEKLAYAEPQAAAFPDWSPPGVPDPRFPAPHAVATPTAVAPVTPPIPRRRRGATAGGYGIAPFGEAPMFRPPNALGAENNPNVPVPAEAVKPLKQEIRELKWLAQAVTDRLEKLEERLYAADGAENPIGSAGTAAEAVPTAPPVYKLQYVKFFGNRKVKSRHLRKQSGLNIGEPWNNRLVGTALTKLQEYYRDKGYDNVKVTILDGDRELDRGVVFLVDEGEDQTICQAEFVGDNSAPDGTKFQAKPPLFEMLQRDVDREKIDEHCSRLYEYYRSLGFLRARISLELISKEDPSFLTIRFLIDEGPRYKVHDIRIVDQGSLTSEEMAKQLQLKEGDFYDDSKLHKDVEAIKDLYQKRGFASVDVQPELHFAEDLDEFDIVYGIARAPERHTGSSNSSSNEKPAFPKVEPTVHDEADAGSNPPAIRGTESTD